jgi:hypothetical protein
MESTIAQLTATFDARTIGEEKAAEVIRRITESEDRSKTEFSVAQLFESGVLPDNTKAFLHLIIDEKYPGESAGLELHAEKLYSLLCDSFIYTFRYLLTPQQFIAEFLSFGGDSISVNEPMLARLSYVVDYPYFTELLDEWFAIELQNGNADIANVRLQEFLSNAERSVMKNSTLDDIAKYLEPLYKFLDIPSIDRNTLEIFLADKDLSIPPDNRQEQFTASDSAFMIFEAYQASELVSPATPVAQIPQYDSFLKELREIGVILPTPHHDEDEKTTSLPPIEMFIPKKLRNKCLEKIFHENINEYDRMIILLNATEDFSQAELNLQTLLGIHKVKPDSKTAMRLYDALRMRFGKPVGITAAG